MKNSRAYSILNQIAVLLTVLGIFSLLAGILPMTTGNNPSGLEFFGGLGVLIIGVVLLVLSDLGARLYRIEAKLGTLPTDDFLEDKPNSRPDAEGCTTHYRDIVPQNRSVPKS